MLTYNDASSPGVEQEDGTDQEGAGQHHADRQQEPVSEANVLLPEQEGVSVRVVEHTLAAKLITDCPHTLDGLHKVAGLAKAVQVEGELGELQGFCSWNCKRTEVTFRIRCISTDQVNTYKKRYLLRRFSPVVSYLS